MDRSNKPVRSKNSDDRFLTAVWLNPILSRAELSVFGRTIYLCLIARRSRHFAGARYRRRGVTEDVSDLEFVEGRTARLDTSGILTGLRRERCRIRTDCG